MKTVKRNKNDFLYDDIQIFLDKKINNENNYNFEIIKKYLRTIYSWICCYCESRFEQWVSMNIEHFYPKKYKNINWEETYSQYSNKLINLHYSCPKCNQLKNDRCPDWNLVYKENSDKKNSDKNKQKNNFILKYPPKNDGFKIFSPNYIINNISKYNDCDFYLPDYKVEDNFWYITFNIFPILNLTDDKKDRAKWTIKMFDLNWIKDWGRFFLREERIRVFNQALKLSEDLNKLINLKKKKLNNNITYLFQELSNMMDDSAPYSTMIKKQFWEIYVKLYERAKLNT